jgi:hypothetical protein
MKADKRSRDFKQAMRMMRGQAGRVGIGNTAEDGFFSLQLRAGEYVRELVSEFLTEKNHGVRLYLIELISEARSPMALPVLVECLCGEEPDFWTWAMEGLRKLNTREARKALWEARSYIKSTDELNRRFQELLGPEHMAGTN